MKLRAFDFDGEQFSAHTEGHVAILKVRGDVYEIAQNFAVKESFFKLLEIFERDANRHCLLVVSDHEVLGEEGHERFWSRALDRRASTQAELMARRDRAELTAVREENTLVQVCAAFSKSSKLVVSAADGSIVAPFFGAMLAGDFRIATNRSTLVFPHVKLRMAPLGAIAYYLPRYIGPSLARRHLLFGSPLPAMRGRELGLFDAVVPVEEYFERSLEFAQQVAEIPRSVAKYTKELLQLEWDHFDEFMDWESNHIRLDDASQPESNS